MVIKKEEQKSNQEEDLKKIQDLQEGLRRTQEELLTYQLQETISNPVLMNRWLIREISIIKEGINQLGGILSESTELLANNRLVPVRKVSNIPAPEVQSIPANEDEYDEDLGEDYVEPEDEEEEEEEVEEEVKEPPMPVRKAISKPPQPPQQQKPRSLREFRI